MRHTFAYLSVIACLWTIPALADPLPSWSEGDAKDRIIEFVSSVTNPASDGYVTGTDRIAVFDNDGTLWAEQPVYFQLIFAMDRLRDMAAADPSVLSSDALKAAANGDLAAVAEGGDNAILEVINATHAGVSVEDYQEEVLSWLAQARHPSTGLAYNQMTYQPMVELLRYLRDEGFQTFIVSGGGIHFMRAFSEEAYGIAPDQIIGSMMETEFTDGEAGPEIVKTPGIAFVDDKEGKPIGIDRHIGKRPVIAVGNSDGDFQMLRWTTAGAGPRLGVLVHHTDAEREFAYDRDSHIGRLNDGLDQGPDLGWLIVDMANDWQRIYTGTPAAQ
ncbi:MAG: HAD family hydrolase [Pseudomonadota bacterium]